MATKATGEIDICNTALVHLKQKAIVSISPPTTDTEKILAEVYHTERRSLIRAHPFNFAIRRAILTRDVVNTPLFGFSDAYTLPTEFLRYLTRHDGDGSRIPMSRDDYEVENGQILINGDGSNELRIRYMYDHTAVSKWDSLFVKLLSLEIASTIAASFVGGKGWTSVLEVKREALKQEAKAIDGQERPPVRVETSRWLSRRRRTGRLDLSGPNIRFRS